VIVYLLCVQVWPYLLGYYKFGATAEERAAQDEAARHQYETTVSEWLAVEAIVTQCDREALEANIARLSAEQNAAAVAAATSSAEAAVRAAAAMLEVVDEGVQADEPTTADDELREVTSTWSRGSKTRLTDDGFGGSVSSDGGSKQDTPVALHADNAEFTADAGRRQKFFVTNPTVDDTSSSAAVTAATAATTVEFDNCSITVLQSDGTTMCLMPVMRPLLGGCIKCCTLSVCLCVFPSVRSVSSIYWKSESHRNFKFGGDITCTRVSREQI